MTFDHDATQWGTKAYIYLLMRCIWAAGQFDVQYKHSKDKLFVLRSTNDALVVQRVCVDKREVKLDDVMLANPRIMLGYGPDSQ